MDRPVTRLNYFAILVLFFVSSVSASPAAAQTRLYILYAGAELSRCTRTDCDPGRLLEIDLERLAIVANTPVRNARFLSSGPRLTPDGRFVIWIGAEESQAPTYLSSVGTSTRRYATVLSLGNAWRFDLQMHPTVTRAFIHRAFAPDIIVATPAGLSTMPAGCASPDLKGMSGDGSRLFVWCPANWRARETAVLDSSTGARVATVPEPHNIQTPNESGTELFSGRWEFRQAALYSRWDVASGALLAQSRAGASDDLPFDIQIDPRTHRLWSLIVGRGIQVLDPSTLSPVGRVEVDGSRTLAHVAFDPDVARAFVISSIEEGTRFRSQLRIIDTDTFSVLMTAELPVQARVVGVVLAPRVFGPYSLTASVTNQRVSLQWSFDSTRSAAAEVIVEAGSAPGASDLAQMRVGTDATSITIANVPPGVYYVRIRVRNAAGSSAVSNEVVVSVR